MATRFDYAKMGATASRLLARFAQGDVKLTRPGTTTPGANPWDPPVVAPAQTWTLKATAKGVSEHYVGTDGIVGTDTEVTIAPFGQEIGASDVLSIDGKPVTVVKVMRIPRAGTVIVWKVVCR